MLKTSGWVKKSTQINRNMRCIEMVEKLTEKQQESRLIET